jgi:flagella basal body P-ring formation protein FlgA
MRAIFLSFAMMCPIVTLAAETQCITIAGDKILAGDLAKAVPEFAAAPADAVLSFAPIPGLTRIFNASDIARFAKRFQTPLGEGSLRSVCFESPAAVLTEDQIRTAILSAIHWPVVSLKIFDYIRSPMPPGRLEFRDAGLTESTLNPTTTWRGRLVMDTGHTFPVWAKVSIVVEAKMLISARPIEKNTVLTSEDVAYSSEASFPLPEGVLLSADEATGRSALRSLGKGSPILKWMLEQPLEVVQGQVVHVDAVCGDAHLGFEGRAQTSGRRGDEITVRNPNGRSFRAKVIDKTRVEVRSSAGA